MSLLSDTQGRPHSVHALIRTLHQLGVSVEANQLGDWLLGVPSRPGAENSRTRVDQTVGCAVSLGWVQRSRGSVQLAADPPPVDSASFFDHLHATLCITQKEEDRRILEAFAVLVLLVEQKRSTDFLGEWNAPQLADSIDQALRGGLPGERLFNPSKLPAWREWVEAVGLGRNSYSIGYLMPDPVPRLIRVVQGLATSLGVGVELPPEHFLDALGREMPYLDRGQTFRSVAERMNHSGTRDQISLVLARALHELEEDGLIVLHQRGDAALGGVRFPASTPFPAKLVVGITIRKML